METPIILEKNQKQYLLVGNENSCSATEIFPLMKDKKLTTGFNKITSFRTLTGEIQELIQPNDTYITLYCGTSTDVI